MSVKVDKQNQSIKTSKVRISISSPSVKLLEKASGDFVNNLRKSGVDFCGPVSMPTKVLKVTTRKTPNGEGSKTWDTYEMRIHRRILRFNTTLDVLSSIARAASNSKVRVFVTIADNDEADAEAE